jgi:hypothetical protein
VGDGHRRQRALRIHLGRWRSRRVRADDVLAGSVSESVSTRRVRQSPANRQTENANHLGFKVLVNALVGDTTIGDFGSAMRAVESRDFQRAIDTLWPIRLQIDDDGLVALALALQSVGRQNDAIDLLCTSKTKGTDPLGVLAGALKRRWLAERRGLTERRPSRSIKVHSTPLPKTRMHPKPSTRDQLRVHESRVR